MTERTVTACPHCDQANATYRPELDRWHCDNCGADFERPVRRAPKQPSRPHASAEYSDWTLADVDLGRGEGDD